MSILSRIKSSFPQGKPQVPVTAELLPLPTTFVHDTERNRLVIEVDLQPLVTNPDAHVNVMYRTTKGADGKSQKTEEVKGFNFLAGLSRMQDFAAVIPVGDTETGIRISKPWGKPSNLSFTVCDVATAEHVARMFAPQAETDADATDDAADAQSA